MFNRLKCLVLLFLCFFNWNCFAEFLSGEVDHYSAGLPRAQTLEPLEIFVSSQGGLAFGIAQGVMATYNFEHSGFHGRVRFVNSGQSQIAFEFFSASFASQDKVEFKSFSILREGTQYGVRIIHSGEFFKSLVWSAFYGFSFSKFISITPTEPPVVTTTFENFYQPDYGGGVSYLFLSWLRIHMNLSYGNSFYIAEFFQPKVLGVLGLHIAPFPSGWPWYFSNWRIEANGVYLHVSAAESSELEGIEPALYFQYSF